MLEDGFRVATRCFSITVVVVASLCAVVSGSAAAPVAVDSPSPLPSPLPSPAGSPPPLQMRDFRAQGLDPQAHGSMTMHAALTSTSLGGVIFVHQNVNVLPDNTYTRWMFAAFEDVLFGRRSRVGEDAAVDACCLRKVETDSHGDVTFSHLRPGRYIAFAYFEVESGKAEDAFGHYEGFDENGNATPVLIPIVTFKDLFLEEYVVFNEFEITAGAPTVTLTPTVVFRGRHG